MGATGYTGTRAQQKIRKAATQHGLVIEMIEYERPGVHLEMCGPSGGWSVWLDDTEGFHVGVAVGYNTDEVIEELKYYARRREVVDGG